MVKKNREIDSSQDEDDDIEVKQLDQAMNIETDGDVLKKLYGDKADLNKDDKFLMDYILNERWKGGKNDDDNYAEYQKK